MNTFELLQALRDDFKLLDEKITTGDLMYIIELIQCIKNNLNELKERF